MNAASSDYSYIRGVVNVKMLAGRVLPPIERSSHYHQVPVATFFNVPRRYIRSNMQLSDSPAESPIDESKPSLSRSLRKSSRIQDSKPGPTSNPQTKEELPSPASSTPKSSRKRPASLQEVTNGEHPADTAGSGSIRSPQSVTSNASEELSPQVCLCQPEPKIPRPRNAFILYRQHHQQAIIAGNPGLNNPDISKIIGEQWKAEGEEIKKVWQDLAQEEKARHQEQYPDYRYQPRRVGKSGSSPLNPSGQHTTVDKYRCPKCGGRSIKTPTSPFLDPSGTPTLPPPTYTEGSTSTTRYLPIMSNVALESPVRRRGHGPSSLSNIQVPLLRDEGSMQSSPATPGYKKRRFEHGPPPPGTGRRPDGSFYPQYARRDSLPPIQVRYSPPNSATMAPPRTPRDGRRPSIVEVGTAVANHHDQSPRSVEEVLMTFPYQNKIKLLGRISLPYKETESVDPAAHVRGAVIAIEGDDTAAVKELAEWLNDRLANHTEYSFHPHIAEPPKAPSENATFEEYLDLIKEWHGKSQDMVKFITTTPSPQVPATSSPAANSLKPSERKDSASDSATPPPPASPPPNPASPLAQSKPIIILPTFQLSASIAYASRIPIQDAYSTTDHWQWMATLWRGTVGPDLTIYVKSFDKEQGGQRPEVDDAVRCLTVWKEREGRFAEADLRRVAFETGEFVRKISGCE